MRVQTFNRAATPRRETATSPPVRSSQRNVFTRSKSQGQGPSHGQLSCATKAGRVEKRVICHIVGDSINDEDRHVVPELSQPLVWVCDMQCVIGQWTGECEICNDSRDVMQVSESVLCRLINRWRMRTVCRPQGAAWRECHWAGQGGDGVGDMGGDSSTVSIERSQIDDPGLGPGVAPEGGRSAGPRADDKAGAPLEDVTGALLGSQRGEEWGALARAGRGCRREWLTG